MTWLVPVVFVVLAVLGPFFGADTLRRAHHDAEPLLAAAPRHASEPPGSPVPASADRGGAGRRPDSSSMRVTR